MNDLIVQIIFFLIPAPLILTAGWMSWKSAKKFRVSGRSTRGSVKMRPSHPGKFLKNSIIPNGTTYIQLSRELKETKKDLRQFLRGLRSISLELAEKFEAAFGVRAETLLRMQERYDKFKLRNNKDDKCGL